jgi:catechol 2,3-dioxygenase-like lactoylglutathione lyase family enzyme
LDAQGVVEIVGADMNATLSFYGSLGFRIERRTGPFAVLNGFGMRIFVAEDPVAPKENRWANIRVVVEDVDLIWKCANAIGLPIAHSISDRPYGIRDFVLADPTGFQIRFAQVIAGRTQQRVLQKPHN